MESMPITYNSNKAKLECSFRWLLTKASVNWNSHLMDSYVEEKSPSLLEKLLNIIPYFDWSSYFRTPTRNINTTKFQFLLTPDIIKGLASAEIYYDALISLFPDDKEHFYESHWSIIRWISKQNINNHDVDETVLPRIEHFDHGMHAIVIDKIMQAFVNKILSLDNVVKAVKKFSSISEFEQLPTCTEDIVTFWSIKAYKHMCEKYRMKSKMQDDRLIKSHSDDLFAKDEFHHLSFGRSLALLLSFYRPDVLKFEDLNLDKNYKSEDELINLERCADVCRRLFPPKFSNPIGKRILHVTIADVYYNYPEFHVCFMVLFAELFKVFEMSNWTAKDVGIQTTIAPGCCHVCGEPMFGESNQINKIIQQEAIVKECDDDDDDRKNERGDEGQNSRKQFSKKLEQKQKNTKINYASTTWHTIYDKKNWNIGDVIPKSPRSSIKVCLKSNKILIENALTYCSLSGGFDSNVKSEVLEVLRNSTSKHFVILFRDSNMQYKGLYANNSEYFNNDTIIKIQGIGPKIVNNKHIEKFYKYNSGAKNFYEVTSTRHLSIVVDAITVFSVLWKKNSKRNWNVDLKEFGEYL